MNQNNSSRPVIWIVDDSPTDASRVSKILANDYQVEVLNDGAIALERLASGVAPDLLLLDWVMPGISGIEVCQYVRSSKDKIPQIPIILLTAQHGSHEIVQAFRSGANDYVSKPFVDEELRSRVDSQLANKNLLARIKQAEGEIRSLLINAPDPILAVDDKGQITFVNNEGRKLFEQYADKIVGMEFSDLIPEITPKHMGLDGETSVAPEIMIGERLFSPSFRILPSDNSASTTVSLRDITDRKKSEAKRLDFYSIIAHDLRTPITSVLLRLQIISRGKYGILPAGLLEDLRKTETSLKAQVSMINDFLELAKLEGVGYKIERHPVNLTSLLNTTLDDFEPLIEKSEINLKRIEPSFDSLVSGDAQRLSQVIANLIGNAIKFTPANGTITTRLEKKEHFIELYIEDTGRGIESDEIDNLFDRFTRTRDSVSHTSGTGLGLMIVREIIEAHGGSVGVTSVLGEGSKFWIKLPIVK